MEVSDKVKSQYHSNSIHKNLKIYFPEIGLTVENDNINYESMRLKESILDVNNIEFVGCIASVFRISLYDIYEDIKGKKIEVSIYTDDTSDEPVSLFTGIVDSAVAQSNKRTKQLIAYDRLYTKGNIEVADWYNSLSFPVKLKYFRDSLFQFIGIEQVEIELPNDEVTIEKKYDPKSLQALKVIKSICQINGAFGIMNRRDKFEYRILADLSVNYVYPSVMLYPSAKLFPANSNKKNEEEMKTESFSFYNNVNYEEYEVKPVDRLTIRQSDQDAGVSYGAGTNNYIIQGNMFTLGKSEKELLKMAMAIYRNVKGIRYHPFESNNNGLPFIECGLDAVSYQMIDFVPVVGGRSRAARASTSKVRNFYIFNRELTGVQALKDTYSAQGEEYQTEFITDLQAQIDTIKTNTQKDIDQAMSDYTYDKDTIDQMIQNAGGGTGDFKVISVKAVPTSYQNNALYLVQGEVFVQ